MMFNMYRESGGNWRWQLVTAAGQVLAESPSSYHHKDDCRAAIQMIKDCRLARVHEIQAPIVATVVGN